MWLCFFSMFTQWIDWLMKWLDFLINSCVWLIRLAHWLESYPSLDWSIDWLNFSHRLFCSHFICSCLFSLIGDDSGSLHTLSIAELSHIDLRFVLVSHAFLNEFTHGTGAPRHGCIYFWGTKLFFCALLFLEIDWTFLLSLNCFCFLHITSDQYSWKQCELCRRSNDIL